MTGHLLGVGSPHPGPDVTSCQSPASEPSGTEPCPPPRGDPGAVRGRVPPWPCFVPPPRRLRVRLGRKASAPRRVPTGRRWPRPTGAPSLGPSRGQRRDCRRCRPPSRRPAPRRRRAFGGV